MFDILLCSNDIQTLSEKVSKCVLGLLYRYFFYSSTWKTFEKQLQDRQTHNPELYMYVRYMYTVLLSLLHPTVLNSACSIQSE